jgi:hypothetical protein
MNRLAKLDRDAAAIQAMMEGLPTFAHGRPDNASQQKLA